MAGNSKADRSNGSQSRGACSTTPKLRRVFAFWTVAAAFCVALTLMSAIAPPSAHARWYDPERGMFLSQDPLRELSGPNSYGFVISNPINFVDPTGGCTQPPSNLGSVLPPNYVRTELGKIRARLGPDIYECMSDVLNHWLQNSYNNQYVKLGTTGSSTIAEASGCGRNWAGTRNGVTPIQDRNYGITIYTNNFSTYGQADMSAILFHEAAHICGLKGEPWMPGIDPGEYWIQNAGPIRTSPFSQGGTLGGN